MKCYTVNKKKNIKSYECLQIISIQTSFKMKIKTQYQQDQTAQYINQNGNYSLQLYL